MSYYASKWAEWADRIVVVTSIACLLIGMSVAQANDVGPNPTVPRPVWSFSDQRMNEVIVIDSDGMMNFDLGASIAWSRHFIVESPPHKCRPVWVLTYANGPGARRPLYLQGCMPVQPKDAP